MYADKNNGFTLIELMVVVAVVAILAAIALPSYQNQVIKSRRADGKQLIMDTAQRMERCYTRFNSYQADACPSGNIPKDADLTDNNYYQVRINTTNANKFSLRAIPRGSQAKDKKCGAFYLDQTGKRDMRTAGGIKGNPSECW